MLWVAAGVAVASVAIPVVTYLNALSIKSEYDDASTPLSDKRRLNGEYDSAKSNAYASVAVPVVLGAAAGGLVAWYFLGGKETRVGVTPRASVSPQGASFSLSGRF